MRTSDALAFFGGSKPALADALGIKVPSIYEWGEFPPPLRQIQIEHLTGGTLKAEPDVFAAHTKRAAA